ncbi:metallophosphoesterase [Anaerococcus sp. ENR1011]|uniref:Metallophosphoesterase n=1 Tax=Anaerococcus groningensis TaxID=3115616 RepID=A0ABW9N1I6_9FIRM
MKKNNKLILALAIASASAAIFPVQDTYAAEDLAVENKTAIVESKETLDASSTYEANLEETLSTENSEISKIDYYSNSSNENKDEYLADEKNESEIRQEDGTDKFDRATNTERKSFGADKNVINIDPEVKRKLEETDGEYGKKDGAYANNNLKPVLTPIKDVVVNMGENERQVAVTWYAKGEVNKDSKLHFGGKTYNVIRARKTNDSNGYSTYTAIAEVEPGKSYEYYVQTGSYKSDIFTLKTKALGKNNKFSVLAYGDSQIGSGDKVWDSVGLYKNTQGKVDQDIADFKKTLKKAEELDPHFYYSMGDNVQVAGYEGESDYLLELPIFKQRILATVAGNHELSMDKDDTSLQNTTFSDHFYLPNESNLGSISEINEDGSTTFMPGNFYYTYGDALFLNLNSNNRNTEEHRAFIENAKAEATKKRGSNFSWTIVSFHHAPYSTATHTSDTDIQQRRHELIRIFNENGVDAVFGGHDHVYARSKQMLAGEQALSFKDAYGIDPKDKNAKIEDGETKLFNNAIYKDGKVIVDGIELNYEGNEVTNPRGTVFLTLTTASGTKFYNPIGENQWFVAKSLDDRNQLFSYLTFDKNTFTITTMDPYGKVIDTYTINKTDEFINNPRMLEKEVSKAQLEARIKQVKNLKLVDNKENIEAYNNALSYAEEVLKATFTSQEEVDAAIKVLETRLSNVEFIAENTADNKADNKKLAKQVKGEKAPKAAKEVKEDKKASKASNKEAKKSSNPKTGITALTGVYASLSLAAAGLFATKRK